MKSILVTGGTGFIGSHTVVELVNAGYQPIIADNFINSKSSVLDRLSQITGRKILFVEVNLCDKTATSKIFDEYEIHAVMHFAGLKAVGESVNFPIRYYENNITSTLSLIEAMESHGVKNLIFSSSATVYGNPSELPLKETSRVGEGITNPYGRTKYMIEQILGDLYASDNTWNITSLRYFNPIGAHSSGKIGEDPSDVPNNLLPFVQQVAIGMRDKLSVFGDDYDTPDGTGIRDYIHVVDLAVGHVVALDKLSGLNVYNLGTGRGTSVLGLVKAFEEASGKKITYEVVTRRPGDIAECFADVSKVKKELGWKANKTIEDACKDAWRWQQFCQTL